jgi:hypothetical protein
MRGIAGSARNLRLSFEMLPEEILILLDGELQKPETRCASG